LRFLFGQEVREVFAVVRSQHAEEDTALLELRLADDVRVQSLFSLGSIEEDRFDSYGERGKLSVDRRRCLRVELADGTPARRTRRSTTLLQRLLAPRRDPSYHAALRHFVHAVRTGQSASPSCWDGYRSLAVVAAAEESARTRRPVSVPQDGDE